jgi:hypothetical protein
VASRDAATYSLAEDHAISRRETPHAPLVAPCHLGLGTLYRRTGDEAKAAEHLTTATTMYREMGMTFWLEQVEAALEPPHGNSP